MVPRDPLYFQEFSRRYSVAADTLAHEKIEAVAILFLHCYRNAVHERLAKEILQQHLPGVFVSASHELLQEYRKFERCSTVVADAFIGPRVQGRKIPASPC